MSMLRAFVAIELPPGLQKAISQVIDRLQSTAGKASVRWVPSGNIHLTLKFLGDVATGSIENIEEALQVEAALHPCFKLEAGGLGAFPNLKHPRVVWLGVDTTPGLLSLQHGIDSITARLGYPSESRPFSPHLTLGRVRENASASEITLLTTSIKEIEFNSPGPFAVKSVHLFKSDLLPTGSVYTKLSTAPLSILTAKEKN